MNMFKVNQKVKILEISKDLALAGAELDKTYVIKKVFPSKITYSRYGLYDQERDILIIISGDNLKVLEDEIDKNVQERYYSTSELSRLINSVENEMELIQKKQYLPYMEQVLVTVTMKLLNYSN